MRLAVPSLGLTSSANITHEFFSSARRRSLLLIAVRPRNSTIRCFLLYFKQIPALPFPMVAAVPAQISKFRPHLHAAAHRRSLPLLTAHYSLPTNPPLATLSSCAQPLCFLSHPCNSSSFMRLRTLSHNGAPLSLLLSMASALFLSPRGYASKAFPTTDFQTSNASTLFSTRAWRLFVRSLHLFLHPFPLFSIVCSLSSKNTPGGGYRSFFPTSAGNQEVST